MVRLRLKPIDDAHQVVELLNGLHKIVAGRSVATISDKRRRRSGRSRLNKSGKVTVLSHELRIGDKFTVFSLDKIDNI